MSDVITETEEEEEQVKENECDGLKNDGNKIDLWVLKFVCEGSTDMQENTAYLFDFYAPHLD